MNNIELNYYINLGLKTFGEVKDFLTLRQNHSAQEATKIITMQRGDLEGEQNQDEEESQEEDENADNDDEVPDDSCDDSERPTEGVYL